MEDVPAEQEVRKGAWTPEEDLLLRKCVEEYGEGQWHLVPTRAGLRRCRKSCRQRWLNYLKPTIKRGAFEEDEADLIIRLHMLLGNRWSLIAGRVPGRTANDIKNYWNSCLSKKVGRSRQESDIRIRSCHGAEAYRPSSNESYSVKQLIPFHAHGNGKSPSSARSVVIKPKPLNLTHRHRPIPFPKMDRGHKTATDHELAREDDPSSWLTNLLAGDEEQQREQHEQEGSTSLPSSLASGEELLDMRQCAEEVEAWWHLWWEDMFLDADPLGLMRTVGGESHASNGC